MAGCVNEAELKACSLSVYAVLVSARLDVFCFT